MNSSKTQKYKEDNKKKQHIITPKRKNNKKRGGVFGVLKKFFKPKDEETKLKLEIRELEEKKISLLEERQKHIHGDFILEGAKKVNREIADTQKNIENTQDKLEIIQENKMLNRTEYNEIKKELDEFIYEVEWINRRVNNTTDLLYLIEYQ